MKRLARSLLAAFFLGTFSMQAFAAAPGAGEVVEGWLVPGIALGDSRAQVEGSIGSPQFCQSVEVAGDRASCSFPVEGGGTVSVRYRGADGGNAGNDPSDVVHGIRWYEQVSGWVTTAGVNTGLAAADPMAVTDAYPDAEVIYNMFGDIYRAVDYALGIEVTWVLDFYSGETHVNMAVFSPQGVTPPPPPPPPADHEVYVADIDLSATKRKRERQVSAVVEIRDEQEQPASGAGVQATWILPDGSTESVEDVASMSGFAHFNVSSGQRGTYTLLVNGVELDDHEFDEGGSVLEESIRVK